jgi:3-oxoacyl-[acyl-carrier protein] reductase
VRFKEKCVIVTGASRGIGRVTALAFAKEGAHLVVNGTNQALLSELVAEIESMGLRCIAVTGDVASPDIAQGLVDAAVDGIGRLDCLVNNAGVMRRASSLDMTLEDWQRVLDVNLTGTLHCCRAALAVMWQQGHGKIVNVASSASKQPHANAAPSYGASKAGVLYITRHLAREYASYGVNVNAVCPGPIESDMTDQWTPEYRESMMRKIPLGRIGRPEEVAATILFLCSEEAGFIVGEAININGGTFMD